jgi:hypothetical protein
MDVRLAKTPAWNEATGCCRMEGESCAAQYRKQDVTEWKANPARLNIKNRKNSPYGEFFVF